MEVSTTQDIQELLHLLILTTGRNKDILKETTHEKLQLVYEILKELQYTRLKTQKFELVNRILLILGIPPMSYEFFDVVFDDVSFSDIEEVKERVNRIRSLYLLEYGSFYLGYRNLRERNPNPVIKKYFLKPGDKEREDIVRKYASTRQIPAFDDIPVSERYSLGYLASKESQALNKYREQLVRVLDEAIKRRIQNPEELKKVAKELGIEDLEKIVIRAAVPNGEKVLWWGPLVGAITRYSSYISFLRDIKDECKRLDSDYIRKIRQRGKKNTAAYLSTTDIDIYFATSMRNAMDFVSNSKFIEEVTKILQNRNVNVVYFDPTQSYLEDRIQKGLVESIMIKRCKIVVYNAQEKETFGKDAEAGIGLAHGKWVVVYVPRILHETLELQEFYNILDKVGYKKEKLGEALLKAEYLNEKQYSKFISPEIEKLEAMFLLKNSKKLWDIFNNIPEEKIKADLISKGYDPTNLPAKKSIREFSFDKMLNFEARALLFKDLHPLSFQISPIDNIARGVFVTRTPQTTAELIEKLLMKDLNYEIVETEHNYLLVDSVTKSPIRALPKDISLQLAINTLQNNKEA